MFPALRPRRRGSASRSAGRNGQVPLPAAAAASSARAAEPVRPSAEPAEAEADPTAMPAFPEDTVSEPHADDATELEAEVDSNLEAESIEERCQAHCPKFNQNPSLAQASLTPARPHLQGWGRHDGRFHANAAPPL